MDAETPHRHHPRRICRPRMALDPGFLLRQPPPSPRRRAPYPPASRPEEEKENRNDCLGRGPTDVHGACLHSHYYYWGPLRRRHEIGSLERVGIQAWTRYYCVSAVVGSYRGRRYDIVCAPFFVVSIGDCPTPDWWIWLGTACLRSSHWTGASAVTDD